MKNFLLVQTAFNCHQLALICEEDVQQLWESNRPRDTLQFLMATLPEIQIKPLAGIVFIQGPGSFTALRIGATWVNTLIYVLKIPVFSFSSLEYVAFSNKQSLDSMAITFDEKRYFYWQAGEVLEQAIAPDNKFLVNPDKNPITVNNELCREILAHLTNKQVSMVDVLYVTPPKITQKKEQTC